MLNESECRSFENRAVIVTGAGSGIGRCIALAYAARGAKVAAADRDFLSAQNTCRMAGCGDESVLAVCSDVSIPDDIIRLIAETETAFGTIDILINNAGFCEWVSPYDLSVEDWDRTVNTNLRGTFLCSREAAKVMRRNGGGSIVNISSTRSLMSEPNTEAYAASKGGIVSLTHALAASFSSDNIQINCICPGWIETKDYASLKDADHAQHFSGRVGKPEDIARACLYLTEKGNNFINGTSLVIDGGMTKKMIYEP